MPRVTVIIPTYNTARYIKEAVDSVLAQTYKDLQLIVVDDGSTDNTREILAPYMDRLTYVYKPNGGFASALNDGIRRADTEYVAWLSADDVFLPEKTGMQVADLDSHPDIAVSFGAYHEIDPSGQVIGTRELVPHYADNVTVSTLLQYCYVNGSTCLFRRTMFDSVGVFDEKIGPAADWEMWLRIAKQHRFHYLRTPLTLYRIHPASGTNTSPSKLAQSNLLVFDKVFEGIAIENFYAHNNQQHALSAFEKATRLCQLIDDCPLLPRRHRVSILVQALWICPVSPSVWLHIGSFVKNRINRVINKTIRRTKTASNRAKSDFTVRFYLNHSR